MSPLWVLSALDRASIPFDHMHRPDTVRRHELEKWGAIVKVAVCVASGHLVEICMSPDCPWNSAVLQESMACDQLRLATVHEVQQFYHGCETYAVPPLGRLCGGWAFIDKSMTDSSYIVFLAGTRKDAIRVPLKEWLQAVAPELVEINSVPGAAAEVTPSSANITMSSFAVQKA